MNANAHTETPTPETTEIAAARVLIVDSNSEYCEMLATLIDAHEGFAVCGIAHEGRLGITAYRQLQPDLVITEINLPGMNGYRLTQLLLRAHPSARILVHSDRDDLPDGLKSLRMGAKGFVRKGQRPSVLITAMRHVVSQGMYLSPSIKESLVSRAIRAEDRRAGSPFRWLNVDVGQPMTQW